MENTDSKNETIVEVVQVDKNKISEAVKRINELTEETIFEGHIKIGTYLLDTFFDNDIKLASSKNPKKQASFNRLCEREDLLVHPNRLAIMVRVASQEKFLDEKSVTMSSLTYTHKASLVKLDNGQKKINLINKCIDNEWTTRELDEEISKILKRPQIKRTSSLLQTTKKYISKVDDVIETVRDSTLVVEDEVLLKMSESKFKDLKKYVGQLKKKGKAASEKSEMISTGCEDLLAQIEEAAKERKKNPPKRGRPPKTKEQ